MARTMNHFFTNAITGMSAVLTSAPADQKHLAIPFSVEPTAIRCDEFALSEIRYTTSPALISLSMIKKFKKFDWAKILKIFDPASGFYSYGKKFKEFGYFALAGLFIVTN